jgi:uncharacterized protein YdhG (YjbR/CyaY superfamily)
LSYLPHSGSVISALKDEVVDYKTSKGVLQFPLNVPLPRSLVERLVRERIAQAWPELAALGAKTFGEIHDTCEASKQCGVEGARTL